MIYPFLIDGIPYRAVYLDNPYGSGKSAAAAVNWMVATSRNARIVDMRENARLMRKNARPPKMRIWEAFLPGCNVLVRILSPQVREMRL